MTNATQFIHVIENLEKEVKEKPQKHLILNSLGIKEDWSQILEQEIFFLLKYNYQEPTR